MPFGALAHNHYWRFDDGVGPSPLGPGGAWMYPMWQTTVLLSSGFGSLQILWERASWAIRWTWRLLWISPQDRVWIDRHLPAMLELQDERRMVVAHSVCLMQSPAYPIARQAVRATATTIGFNKIKAWKSVGNQLKERADWAENSWRHLEAMRRMDWECFQQNIKLNNPQKNGIVELAYQGYALKPKD